MEKKKISGLFSYTITILIIKYMEHRRDHALTAGKLEIGFPDLFDGFEFVDVGVDARGSHSLDDLRIVVHGVDHDKRLVEAFF